MSTPQASETLPAFFVRNNLTREDLAKCLRFAAHQWPGHVEIRPAASQGGCSFTVLLGSDRQRDAKAGEQQDVVVLQFRLLRHAISLHLAEDARCVYRSLAPKTYGVDELALRDDVARVQVCAMSCVPGRQYGELQPRIVCLDEHTVRRYEVLLTSLADFFARSWRAGFKGAEGELRCSEGKVGSTIATRLEKLECELPSRSLRDRALHARLAVEQGLLDVVPVVLTHGDLLPSNIMVDEETWAVNGYVDWAEAEWLPFGVGIYGLEHLLSYVDGDAGRPLVVFYEQADQLRKHFWAVLERLVPDVSETTVREAVLVARDVGVLLWHGFAWDDGRIDRVVNAVDDGEDLAYLHAFIDVPNVASRRDSRLAV